MLEDQYILHGKLGYGEFGEVWKGESKRRRTSVAIKIFKSTCKDIIINNELTMNAEIKVIAHPSLVKVLDVDVPRKRIQLALHK